MCCDKPCLAPAWENGKYGQKCINCQDFKES